MPPSERVPVLGPVLVLALVLALALALVLVLELVLVLVPASELSLLEAVGAGKVWSPEKTSLAPSLRCR